MGLTYDPIRVLMTDVCTIYRRTATVKANGATGFTQAAVVTDQLCRLSFGGGGAAVTDRNLTTATTGAVLFLPSEISLPEGADVDVTKNGHTYHLRAAGIPRVYEGHIEVDLEERDKP